MKQSRNRMYRGVLAEPMKVQPSELRERDMKLICDRLTERLDKLALLCDHFHIDRAKPGWKRDLALSLVVRHCPQHVAGQGISVGDVFTEYGIDPTGANADFELALRLADRYVPGFHIKLPPLPFGRLSPRDFALLAVAAHAVREYFHARGRAISDRYVASAVWNQKLLQSLMEPSAAAEVFRILSSGGNKSRGARSSLSDRALRGYLRLTREAMTAHEAGAATRLQREIAEAVLRYCKKTQS